MSNVWVSGSDLDIEINIARDAVKRAEYQAREALHKYMRAGIPEVSTAKWNYEAAKERAEFFRSYFEELEAAQDSRREGATRWLS